MLNQLIPVSGTIIAALIGFIALVLINSKSNHHTLELEKLRIGAEESRERSKRYIAAIEEVFQTLLLVDDLCTQLAYDAKNLTNQNKDLVERIKQIRSTSQKITMLIRLHLPDLGKDLEEYSEILGEYWDAIGAVNNAKGRDSKTLEILHEKFALKELLYKKRLEKMFIKLEEHVQKSSWLEN